MILYKKFISKQDKIYPNRNTQSRPNNTFKKININCFTTVSKIWCADE